MATQAMNCDKMKSTEPKVLVLSDIAAQKHSPLIIYN